MEAKTAPVIRPSVLIVDDEESMQELLSSILKDYKIHRAKTLGEARRILLAFDIQLVLLDIRLKGEDGLSFLPVIKEINDQIEVIVITVVKDIKTAVGAMRQKAFDYINKDFDYDELRALVDKALEKQRSSREILCLREEINQHCERRFFIGTSKAMLKAETIAAQAAPLPTTVLIFGETGTGKELMARHIHGKSHLSQKPFVTVNLAAIPPELMESTLFGHEKGAFTGAHSLRLGKFELACGGTLFLDEIGELRHDLQAKLLRALQENEIERVGGNKIIPVNIRLIAATNTNLKEKIRAKEFREDLYYRLNVVPIFLPPLRERREDIGDLMRLFVERYSRKFNRPARTMTPEAEKMLMIHNWPGNIRELENLVERIVALSGKECITPTDIPLEYQLYQIERTGLKEGEEVLQMSVNAFEKNFIIRILEESDWNQTLASRRLGIHRKTLEYKMKRLDLGKIIHAKRHETL